MKTIFETEHAHHTTVFWRDGSSSLHVIAASAKIYERSVLLIATDGAVHLIPLDQIKRIQQVPK